MLTTEISLQVTNNLEQSDNSAGVTSPPLDVGQQPAYDSVSIKDESSECDDPSHVVDEIKVEREDEVMVEVRKYLLLWQHFN